MVRIITSDITTLQERAVYIGGISAAWGISGTMGGLVGGAIVSVSYFALTRNLTSPNMIPQSMSWQYIFLLNIPIGLLAAMLFTMFLNLHRRSDKTVYQHLEAFDTVGLLLIVGGAACRMHINSRLSKF